MGFLLHGIVTLLRSMVGDGAAVECSEAGATCAIRVRTLRSHRPRQLQVGCWRQRGYRSDARRSFAAATSRRYRVERNFKSTNARQMLKRQARDPYGVQ